MSEINLLRKKEPSSSKSQKILRILRAISFGLLFITSIASVGLFLLNFTSPVSSLQQEKEKITSSLQAYQDQATKLSVINERVKSIAGVIAKRRVYDEDIEAITGVLPANASIDSLSVNKNKIILITSSTSLLSLNTFMDNLVGFSLNKKIFNKVSLTDLTFDKDKKQYRVSLDADLL